MTVQPPTSLDAAVGPAAGEPGDTRPLVIVTGGSGLLGSTLIERLVESCRVVSLDLDGDPASPTPVEFNCTDLTDDDSVERAFGRIRAMFGCHTASIVHLAAATVIAVIAMGEVVRSLRLLNVAVGAIVAVGVWFTAAETGLAMSLTATGVVLAAVSIPHGVVRERYAGWDRLIV